MENNQNQQNLSTSSTQPMMPKAAFIQTSSDVYIHVCDQGKGKPVILIHGWPSSAEMWEYQSEALVKSGHRVITYDRRGFGKSSKPWDGYDYDTMTDDLKAIIDALQLTDITLVGFSMGGGEVVRYFSRHGGTGVTKAVLVSSVTPFLLKTDDNPDGMPMEAVREMGEQIKKDRIAFLEEFGKKFFGVGLVNHPVSAPYLDYFRMLASCATERSTLECATSFATTDFRDEMMSVNVPTLMIHGDDDKIVPIEISSEKAAALIPNCRYVVYDGAPHGLFQTEKDKLNRDLIAFLNS